MDMDLKTIINDFTGFKKLACSLALAGTIPFLFCTLGVLLKLSASEDLLKVQLAYCVIILSFLGGIHWGTALASEHTSPKLSFWLLMESVLPAILGWILLLPDAPAWQLNGFIALYVLVWLLDAVLTYFELFAKWFLGLRTLITALVVTLLLLTKLAIASS